MAATTIVLVDDDEIIRSGSRDILSHKGFIVTVAGSVVGALNLIEPQRFDVLPTDLHIPRAGEGQTETGMQPTF